MMPVRCIIGIERSNQTIRCAQIDDGAKPYYLLDFLQKNYPTKESAEILIQKKKTRIVKNHREVVQELSADEYFYLFSEQNGWKVID